MGLIHHGQIQRALPQWLRRLRDEAFLSGEESLTMRRRLVIATVLSLVVTGLVLLERAVRQHVTHVRQQENRQRYLQEEQSRNYQNASVTGRRNTNQKLVSVGFDKSNARGLTIRRSGSAFQRGDFTSAILDDATLEAGSASFQFACFNNASLRNAKLTASGSSFQYATFIGADLTAARLNGSFQRASFEGAVLTRAVWLGSFQCCNINGARFEGADLSEIWDDSLNSCYFAEAPTYSVDTKFPAGFNPASQGWQQVSE